MPIAVSVSLPAAIRASLREKRRTVPSGLPKGIWPKDRDGGGGLPVPFWLSVNPSVQLAG